MIEACCAIPLAYAIVAADCDLLVWVLFFEKVESWVECLDAAVERAGVEDVDGRVESDKVFC